MKPPNTLLDRMVNYGELLYTNEIEFKTTYSIDECREKINTKTVRIAPFVVNPKIRWLDEASFVMTMPTYTTKVVGKIHTDTDQITHLTLDGQPNLFYFYPAIGFAILIYTGCFCSSLGNEMTFEQYLGVFIFWACLLALNLILLYSTNSRLYPNYGIYIAKIKKAIDAQ